MADSSDDRSAMMNSDRLEKGDAYNGNEKSTPESPRSVHGVKVSKRPVLAPTLSYVIHVKRY